MVLSPGCSLLMKPCSVFAFLGSASGSAPPKRVAPHGLHLVTPPSWQVLHSLQKDSSRLTLSSMAFSTSWAAATFLIWLSRSSNSWLPRSASSLATASATSVSSSLLLPPPNASSAVAIVTSVRCGGGLKNLKPDPWFPRACRPLVVTVSCTFIMCLCLREHMFSLLPGTAFRLLTKSLTDSVATVFITDLVAFFISLMGRNPF